MAKGSSFEREICRQLSLWWTQDEDPPRDDVFWRTAGSGARATTRAKKGSKTAGGCGDICALDPIGKPFLDMFAVEIKRGYSKETLHSLLDNSYWGKKQKWSEWIGQAALSCDNAGCMSWIIIAKRDGRETVVVMPNDIIMQLATNWCPIPSGLFHIPNHGVIVCVLLEDFIEMVKPSVVIEQAKLVRK